MAHQALRRGLKQLKQFNSRDAPKLSLAGVQSESLLLIFFYKLRTDYGMIPFVRFFSKPHF
jgi:hypothetical protein